VSHISRASGKLSPTSSTLGNNFLPSSGSRNNLVQTLETLEATPPKKKKSSNRESKRTKQQQKSHSKSRGYSSSESDSNDSDVMSKSGGGYAASISTTSDSYVGGNSSSSDEVTRNEKHVNRKLFDANNAKPDDNRPTQRRQYPEFAVGDSNNDREEQGKGENEGKDGKCEVM